MNVWLIGLSRKELHREVWMWTFNNDKHKSAWPYWELFKELDPTSYGTTCFACGETGERKLKTKNDISFCTYCPIDWGFNRTCEYPGTAYDNWECYASPVGEANYQPKYAIEIANLPWKE